MTPSDARITLLLALSVPNYARADFYRKKQRESGFSEIVFCMALIDAYRFYMHKIESQISEMKMLGNNVTGCNFPLLTETNGLLTGHFGLDELKDGIFPALEEIANEIKQRNPDESPFENEFISLTNKKGETYHIPFKTDQIPKHYHYEGIIKWFSEGYFSETELQKWSNDYNFFITTVEENTGELLIEKGIELANIYLLFELEHNKNNFKAIRSWERRIKIAEGIKKSLVQNNTQIDAEQVEPPITSKLSSPRHYFVLLWELGLIDALKKRCEGLSSKRLGELLEKITGQKSEDFRRVISYPDPTTTDLFNDTSINAVSSFLKEFGLDTINIDNKIKRNKK